MDAPEVEKPETGEEAKERPQGTKYPHLPVVCIKGVLGHGTFRSLFALMLGHGIFRSLFTLMLLLTNVTTLEVRGEIIKEKEHMGHI